LVRFSKGKNGGGYKGNSGWSRIEHGDFTVNIIALFVFRHDADCVDPDIGEVVEPYIMLLAWKIPEIYQNN
jgi:hypothetical protein